MAPATRGPKPSPATACLPTAPQAWVYLLRCPDGSLYCGWTNDLTRRLRAHRTGKGGAKYTKSHGAAAVTFAYTEHCADKSEALRREIAIKKLPKADKEALCAAWVKRQAVTLRMATPDDAAAVLDIYRWYVTHSTATFQYHVPTEADYRAMIARTLEKAPFLVAHDGDGRLVGYAYAHPWHEREAYSWDAEASIYCAQDTKGLGLGRKLYTALLALLKEQGYYNVFALITRHNPASEAFHKSMGFARFGVEERTGYKFGRWLSLGYWHLPLRPATDTAAPAPVRYTLPKKTVAQILQQATDA